MPLCVHQQISKPALQKGSGKSAPIYAQLHQYLKEIVTSDGCHQKRLPPINTMVSDWGVGYNAVKSALDLLEEEGLVRCEKGRGKGPLILRPQQNKKCSISFIRWNGEPMLTGLEKGIRTFLEEVGQELTLVDVWEDEENYYSIISNLPEINGLILLPWDTKEYRLAVERALQSGIHIVFVDRPLPNIPVGSVSADHYSGAYRITNHLIETHDRPVYYLPITCLQRMSCIRRMEGWAAAMHQHSYDPDCYLWDFPLSDQEKINQKLSIAYLIEYSAVAAKRLFQSGKEDKYYIFAINDYVAQGVYFAAEELGLKIGKDVFVAGFGDMPLCTKLDVPLTSASQSNENVGYEAAKMLYNKIFRADHHLPVNLVLPVELCLRKSTKGA